MRTAIALILLAAPVAAESVAPVRAIRARELIAAADLKLLPGDMAGGFSAIDDVAGLEARVALYPGRPVRRADVGPPAVIERNQVVALVFYQGGLEIRTEARALDRAGVGDLIRAMNLASRATVTGQVMPDGTISVGDGRMK